MEVKNFVNLTINKQWRIEIDGHTIRTCPHGGKVKEILCDPPSRSGARRPAP